MDLVLLVARICLSIVFLFSGIHKAVYFEAARKEFRAVKLPFPDFCLVIVVLLHLIAPLCIIFGVFVDVSAVALAIFTIMVTLWVRDFWNRSGNERLNTARDATANLAIIGGLLILSVVGPGSYTFN